MPLSYKTRWKKLSASLLLPGLGKVGLLAPCSGLFASSLMANSVPVSISFCAGEKQPFNPAEESQAFLQLTAVCQDRTLVGMKLLDKIPSVPHGELSCSKSL